jgi:hypothetical protein
MKKMKSYSKIITINSSDSSKPTSKPKPKSKPKSRFYDKIVTKLMSDNSSPKTYGGFKIFTPKLHVTKTKNKRYGSVEDKAQSVENVVESVDNKCSSTGRVDATINLKKPRIRQELSTSSHKESMIEKHQIESLR